jgi:hypothetical protein
MHQFSWGPLVVNHGGGEVILGEYPPQRVSANLGLDRLHCGHYRKRSKEEGLLNEQ